MPRGGARIGAGRKPKKRPKSFESFESFAPVVLDGGKSNESNVSAFTAVVPTDLPEEQVPIWRDLAPLALERHTLTLSTTFAFRELCQLCADERAMTKQITTEGRTYLKVTIDGAGQEHDEVKAHPLTATRDRTRKDINARLKDFDLAPFGKPVRGMEPKNKPADARRARFFGAGGKTQQA